MTAIVSSARPRAPIGVLVMNVGSPEAPEPGPVRTYLREFLSDPRVIDIHPLARGLLLELVILPTRPRASAEAYRKVWTSEGSPLLVNSRRFASELGRLLGPEYRVALGMRYGQPSISAALDAFAAEGIDRVLLFPLYPQYASSSTGTALEAAMAHAGKAETVASLTAVPAFYDDPAFVGAFAERCRAAFETPPDLVLFSFHGLPERHMRKGDTSGAHCLASATCCDRLETVNRNCYRAQCYATARGIAHGLGLDAARYEVSFQSRLGRTPWIKPYTDEVVPGLPARGVKHLAVACPAFVADCLETLEEVGMRLRHDFLRAGGETFTFVPSLNAEPSWIAAAAALVRRFAPVES